MVNPVVPVAQFEAFKVYEDKPLKITESSKFQQNVLCPVSLPPKSEEFDTSVQNMSIELQLNNSILEIPKVPTYDVLDVEEYQEDIYKYLRQHEMKNRAKPMYMRKQPDINHNMRTILVDWLVEVGEEYKLGTETLYLAVNYIDRFLSYMSVVRGKLQLVGTAAMFIASKYEEIYPPDVSEFVYITDDTYNKKQVIRMELLILKVLKFDISVPTPLTFIRAICIRSNVKDKLLYLAMYLCELAMLEAEPYLELLPSVIGSSAIALAQHTLGETVWPEDFIANTGYQLENLKKGITFLHLMFTKASSMAQHAIQDKYSSLKYLHVSQITPREDLIRFN